MIVRPGPNRGVELIRPGPNRIAAGVNPGGVVVRVYEAGALRRLVLERNLSAGGEALGADDAAFVAAILPAGVPAVIVTYDGDTGARFVVDGFRSGDRLA